MTTVTLMRKLSEQLENLHEEVSFLRDAFLGTLSDPEGNYQPDFVEKILNSEKEPAQHSFTTPAAFLKHINGRTRKNPQ